MVNMTLFIGYYGRNNLGDDLMLEQLYTEGSYVFLQDNNFYSFIPKEKQIVLSKKIIKKTFQKVYFLILLKLKGLRQLTFGGGTQFSSNSSKYTQIDNFLLVLISKALNIFVKADSVGIGAIKSNDKTLIKTLKLFDFISVRDKTSSFKLKNINHTLTKDLVYKINFNKQQVIKNKILITATGPVLRRNKFYTENYLSFLDIHIDRNETEIYYCIFQKGEDDFIFHILKKRFPKLKILKIATKEEVESVYSKAKFVVGMRYHSLILADIFDVPFVGFSYDDKVKDLCYIKKTKFYSAKG